MAALSTLRRLPAAPRRLGAALLTYAVAVPALPVLAAAAPAAPVGRPPRRGRPRGVGGLEPILSYAHWSRAVRNAGYESETVMHSVYTAINRHDDFDLLYEDLVAPQWAWLLGPYRAFLRSLFRADVFQHHYSGGF